MVHFLGSSAVLNTILNILGVAGIIIFGSFVIILVVDLILASADGHQGIFFNRKGDKAEEKTDVNYVAEENPAETTENSGVVYNDQQENADPYVAPEDGVVNAVDFNKAVAEQQALQNRLEDENTLFDNAENEEENSDEDITKIAEDVAKQAIAELNDEADVKSKKVFKFKDDETPEENINDQVVEEPVVEAEPQQEVVEEPIVVEPAPEENEELKRLEQERQELEKKVAELEELFAEKKDEEEIWNRYRAIRTSTIPCMPPTCRKKSGRPGMACPGRCSSARNA